MKFLVEYKSFYQEGDIVLIEFWYKPENMDRIITPVQIIEKRGKSLFRVSHDNPHSKLRNAPDEIIKSGQIITKLDLGKTAQA